MALRLTLKPHERVIINGCVLKNGPRRHMLEIENRADVLRGDEMLDAETAKTPVRRLAYHIQIALVSQAHRGDYLPLIRAGLHDLLAALPRFAQTISQVEVHLAEQNYYGAFRALAPLIAYEDQIFTPPLEALP